MQRRDNAFLLAVSLFSFSLAFSGSQPESYTQRAKGQQREEKVDYYRQWLEQIVSYIISEEERDVFKKLTTNEERDAFIEQFWLRRDPNPATAVNEFKEEHYRRIAYANEHFTSGIKGWLTDRGRVYIVLGPPDSIEDHFSGGRYDRELNEGGGTTQSYPFEKWLYRHAPGIGSDIEIEFVDNSLSGEYHIALFDWEKDALLNVPGAGPTFFEKLGLTTKEERPYFSGLSSEKTKLGQAPMLSKDMPFARLEQYFKVQAPPEIKFRDLKGNVESKVFFHDLSSLRHSYAFVRLNQSQFLVPITIEIDNKELQFESIASQNLHSARLSLYGRITNLTGRTQAEFEDEVAIEYESESLEKGLTQKSSYQKMVVLEPGHYKLDLVVKDIKSGKLSSLQGGIIIPTIDTEKLQSSSLILARWLSRLPRPPEQLEMFVLGDLKVFPTVDKKFSAQYPLYLYFHLYNVGIDQASRAPSLQISYEILRDNQLVEKAEDLGESIYYYSEPRIVVIKAIPLKSFAPGSYKLRVTATDKVKGEQLQIEQSFSIAS